MESSAWSCVGFDALNCFQGSSLGVAGFEHQSPTPERPHIAFAGGPEEGFNKEKGPGYGSSLNILLEHTLMHTGLWSPPLLRPGNRESMGPWEIRC